MRRSVGILTIAAAVLAGCGFQVSSADVFLLTRTGQGRTLTLLVNDAGTIRCNGAKPKPLSDRLLLQARDLATNLDNDAKAGLSLRSTPGSVYSYTVKLQDGEIRFPDTAAGRHKELAPAELFAVQAAQSACGVS